MSGQGVGSGWRAHVRGLVILTVLAALSTVVFFLDTVRRTLAEGPRVVVLATEARGLQKGASVWVAGKPTGRVTEIHFGDPTGPEARRVVIEAVLHRSVAPYLRRDTRAHVSPAALLAPAVLKLDPGESIGDPFDFSDTLYVPRNLTSERLLALSDTGRAEKDTLLELLSRFRHRVVEGPGTLARLRDDTALIAGLIDSGFRLGDLRRSLRDGEGLVSFLSDDSLRGAAGRAMASLGGLAGDRTATAIRDSVASLLASIDGVSRRLTILEGDLRAGGGTAGRAAHDTELRDQAILLRAALDSVRADLMADPFRWLRFRLF